MIFWKKIKGENTYNSDKVTTYIDFTNGINGSYAPIVKTMLNGGSLESLGEIVLTKPKIPQYIETQLKVKSLNINFSGDITWSGAFINVFKKDGNYFKIGSLDGSNYIKSPYFDGNTTVNGDLNILNKKITAKEADFTDRCQAKYFNATSDRRLKTNIKLPTFSAIDFINQVPVYSFTFKEGQQKSVGIMAQDLSDAEKTGAFDLDGFSFVEEGEHLSIKESKLIYVLWQAIQEQSAQIKQLQEEISKLKRD